MSKGAVVHIDTQQLSSEELNYAAQAAHVLPADSPVRHMLQSIIDAHSSGARVTALSSDAELSPNEAARILGISRPHLSTFIRSGALQVRYVGAHKRIAYSDLMDFKQRYDRASKDVATALAGSNATAGSIELSDDDLAELDQL